MKKNEKALTVAFTGGGGKTSLILGLAEKFSGQGKRVIVTTTTHMAWEPEHPFAEAEDVSGACRLIEQYGYVIAAHHKAGQPKISGPEKEILEKLSGFCDLLLVEADGSRRRPLKVPAVHEPVIPSFADMVVGVIGLDCIGKKICDTAHRPDDVAGFLGKRTDEPVTWMDVWKIIRSEAGLQKGVDGRRFLAYLNKADTLEDPGMAEKLMAQGQEAGIMVICGSLQRSVLESKRRGAVI